MAKVKAIPYTVNQTGEDTKPTLDVSAKGLTIKQVQELIEVLSAAIPMMRERQAGGKLEAARVKVQEAFPDARVIEIEGEQRGWKTYTKAIVIEDGIVLGKQAGHKPIDDLWMSVAKMLPTIQQQLSQPRYIHVQKQTTINRATGESDVRYFSALTIGKPSSFYGLNFRTAEDAISHARQEAKMRCYRVHPEVQHHEETTEYTPGEFADSD
jgi:hypothetical protein